jgi:hypothetical protein
MQNKKRQIKKNWLERKNDIKLATSIVIIINNGGLKNGFQKSIKLTIKSSSFIIVYEF